MKIKIDLQVVDCKAIHEKDFMFLLDVLNLIVLNILHVYA